MNRFIFSLAIFLVTGFAFAQPKKEPLIKVKGEEIEMSLVEVVLIEETNKGRKKEGLEPLRPNRKLLEAARSHAENMAKQSKADHELDGKKPSDRITAAGYKFQRFGENIAWNQKTSAEALDFWMKSEVHRKNILTKEFTEIGVAMAKNEKGEPYWVQVFGTPLK